MKIFKWVFLLFGVLIISAFSLQAAVKTFTGPGVFSDASKWNGGSLPQAGDDLIIIGTCSFDNSASSLEYGNLTAGDNGNTGTLSWPSSGSNTLNVNDLSSAVSGSSIDMT